MHIKVSGKLAAMLLHEAAKINLDMMQEGDMEVRR